MHNQQPAAQISQFFATLVGLGTSPKRHRWSLYLLLLLVTVAWVAFLVALVISRLHRPYFLAPDVPNTIPWFDPSDGFFITLPFLLPGLMLALTTWLHWTQIRYRNEATAVATLLREMDEDLLPEISVDWLGSSVFNRTTFKAINFVGWQASLKRTNDRFLYLLLTSVLANCLSAVDQLTRNYATGVELIDLISLIVAILLPLLAGILVLRNLTHNTDVVIDDLGMTLPILTPASTPVRVLWGDIRALYMARVSMTTYWILMSDDHLYGWSQNALSFNFTGTPLAQAIIERTRLPVRDITMLGKVAVGQAASDTLAAPIQQRWQLALDEADRAHPRPRVRYVAAIIFGILGLIAGIAATVVIAQIAAQSL